MRFLLFLLLGFGVAFAAPDLLMWLRRDILPPEADLSHAWGDFATLLGRIVLSPLPNQPDLRDAPPFSQERVMVAALLGLVVATCFATFLLGGLAALGRWLTPILVLAIAGLFVLHAYGAFAFPGRADAQRAQEALAVLAVGTCLVGNLWARALRHLRR